MPSTFHSLFLRLQRLRDLRIYDERRLYAAWEERHLRRLLPHLQVDCVFDVGANVGQYATMLRRKARFRGLIISFEPIPEAVEVLREKSRGDPLWVVEPIALSSVTGTASFRVMNSSQFSSLAVPLHTETALFRTMNVVERVIPVRTETLPTALERLRREHGFARPFLKLDTQGSDTAIVRAADKVMSQFVGLQSELAVKRIYDQAVDFREAITVYEQLGFELSALVPNNVGHFPALIETDGIFVGRQPPHAS